MGHMIVFGLLCLIAGITHSVGRDSGPDAGFGHGLVAAGVVALIWAGLVLLVRLIP